MLTTPAQPNSTTDTSSSSAPSYVEEYTPPTPQASATPQPAAATPASPAPAQQTASSNSGSELLEDQNIFTLLGVLDGTEEQREKFLDELQQVIWEDFLEYDVKLLITQDEYTELEKLLAEEGQNDLEKQEKIVVYLEKLIPDLEEIMLDKALELKEELTRERLAGVREYFAGKDDQLKKLDEVEALMQEGKWRSAAEMLNNM